MGKADNAAWCKSGRKDGLISIAYQYQSPRTGCPYLNKAALSS